MLSKFANVDAALQGLAETGYVANREIAVAGYLMDALERPLLVEGPSGVGKTELARALSQALGRPLLRLQCYEGLDESRALYEWEYGKQLLVADLIRPQIQNILSGTQGLHEAVDRLADQASALFDPRFLLERPLLAALRSEQPTLLLIDEVDRADPEFEALLLEVLADFQVSIPELGTLSAKHKPRVVLTSNRSREMSDALRRRCLYLHVDYPEPSRELAILRARVPGVEQLLSEQIVRFVQRVRRLDLKQRPSVAETVDWARTLVLLSADSLAHEFVRESLVALAKQPEDREQVASLLGEADLV
ncbi:MAG: MoxR family ATPase [Myxococcales bacterium]